MEFLLTAWLTRFIATCVSFALCLLYVLLLPFQPLGMAVLIGLGTLLMMLWPRREDIVTTGITIVVVMVVAAMSPRDVWRRHRRNRRRCRIYANRFVSVRPKTGAITSSTHKKGEHLNNTDSRIEKDSLGEVKVPADRLWGAQTQRSLEHFSIGQDLIPREMIGAYAILKKATANANHVGKRLDEKRHGRALASKIGSQPHHDCVRHNESSAEIKIGTQSVACGSRPTRVCAFAPCRRYDGRRQNRSR
jgi:Lyase